MPTVRISKKKVSFSFCPSGKMRRKLFFLLIKQSFAQSHGQRRGTLTRARQLDMPVLIRSFMKGLHGIKHMIGQFAACPMWTTRTQRIGHIRNPQTPAILVVAVCERHLIPLAGPGLANTHGTAKAIGIGHAQRALSTIDLDEREFT